MPRKSKLQQMAMSFGIDDDGITDSDIGNFDHKWIDPIAGCEILKKYYVPPEETEKEEGLKRFNVRTLIDDDKFKCYILVGNRSSGKTYSIKAVMFEDFMNEQAEFMYCRIEQTDLKKSKYDLWTDFCEIAFPNLMISIQPYKGDVFLCRFTIPETMERYKFKLGKLASLLDSDVLKGGSLPRMKNIFIDEFMSENGTNPQLDRVIPSMLTSVFRTKTDGFRLFMAANAIRDYIPLYGAMGLPPKLIKGRTEYDDLKHKIRYRRFVIEEIADKMSETAAGLLFSQSKYMGMATRNEAMEQPKCIMELVPDDQIIKFAPNAVYLTDLDGYLFRYTVPQNSPFGQKAHLLGNRYYYILANMLDDEYSEKIIKARMAASVKLRDPILTNDPHEYQDSQNGYCISSTINPKLMDKDRKAYSVGRSLFRDIDTMNALRMLLLGSE